VLLLGLPLRRVDLEAAGVERLDQPVDHRALSGRAEALDRDDDRDALFLADALQAAELCIQPARQRVKFLLAQFFGEVDFFQHSKAPLILNYTEFLGCLIKYCIIIPNEKQARVLSAPPGRT